MNTPVTERCLVLIKAEPHSGSKHGETVCCAGVTAAGEWRRLYPVRFRSLQPSQQFSRWDWITYRARRPAAHKDRRTESRRIEEDSLRVDGAMKEAERSRFLSPVLAPSWRQAHADGRSLALVRPKEGSFRLYAKRRTPAQIERQRQRACSGVAQLSMLDKPLTPLVPIPWEFRATFEDASGVHDRKCGDWETDAMFWRFKKSLGEEGARVEMERIFNEDYNRKGVVVAMGNQARSPATWMLLGLVRLDDDLQMSLI